MGFSEELKKNRMVFYENDVAELNQAISAFIDTSKAECVLLIDVDGHMVTKQGFTKNLNTDSIAALVAGAFASTKELAKQLGEPEFSVMFHQGKNENMHISSIQGRALIVIIFDDRTTIGMIRAYSDELQKKLSVIFEAASKKSGGVSDEYAKGAADKMDEFFKE
jgi:predicted regulator of Ras-like GTPase activity (Roadblock/LC7/MglB family)